MKKPEVGQTLYSLNIGNAARRSPQELTEVVVKKVGRKYFACGKEGRSEHMWTQYHLNGWYEKTEYSANSRIFATKQEWEDLKEREELYKEIRDSFDGFRRKSLSLDALRVIKEIIDKNTTEVEE